MSTRAALVLLLLCLLLSNGSALWEWAECRKLVAMDNEGYRIATFAPLWLLLSIFSALLMWRSRGAARVVLAGIAGAYLWDAADSILWGNLSNAAEVAGTVLFGLIIWALRFFFDKKTPL